MKKGSKVFVFITAMLLTLGGMKAIAHHRGYDRAHYGCHGMHHGGQMNGCHNGMRDQRR